MDRIKTILHLFFTLCAVTTFYAQTGMQPDEKKNNGFEKVTNLYLAGKLHDTVYMGMVDSLAALSLDKGVYYGVSEMPDNLKQYEDRKSTRLNSSHVKISYAVFCLKKKKNICASK